jgi:prepilin-type N-terminal cleavage/methylation domain-containing protein
MRRQRGFSLVEVLMALVVLGIVITTTLAMFVERQRRAQQANETILAYQALANEAEVRRRIPYDGLDTAQPGFLTDTALLKPLAPFRARVTVADETTDVKRVTMSISWKEDKRVARLVLMRVNTGGTNLW